MSLTDKQYKKGLTPACMLHSFLVAPQVITSGERQMLLFFMIPEMASVRVSVIWVIWSPRKERFVV